MRRGLISCLSLIVPLLLAPPLCADDAEGGREQMLDERRARLNAKWEARFRAADSNEDRLLTEQECRDGGLPHAIISRFKEIDADTNGGLAPEEIQAWQDRRVQAQRMRAGPRP